MPATLRDCARFSVYYASTFFLLEVIVGPIIAVVTGGHKVLAAYLLQVWDVSLLRGLGVMLSAFAGAILQGLTVVAVSSTLSLGVIWKLMAIRRGKLKPR